MEHVDIANFFLIKYVNNIVIDKFCPYGNFYLNLCLSTRKSIFSGIYYGKLSKYLINTSGI
jgi:hypothetical protein